MATTAVEKRTSVPTLVLLYNGLEVSRHLVSPGKPVIIGRSKGSDVVISLLGLSRRHTQVIYDSGVVTVRDLGSQNGTFVFLMISFLTPLASWSLSPRLWVVKPQYQRFR